MSIEIIAHKELKNKIKKYNIKTNILFLDLMNDIYKILSKKENIIEKNIAEIYEEKFINCDRIILLKSYFVCRYKDLNNNIAYMDEQEIENCASLNKKLDETYSYILKRYGKKTTTIELPLFALWNNTSTKINSPVYSEESYTEIIKRLDIALEPYTKRMYIPNFKVITELNGNKLKCRTDIKTKFPDIVIFYLSKYGEKKLKLNLFSTNGFKLEESGAYSLKTFFIRGFNIKKGYSKVINYFDDKTKKEYEAFVNSQIESSLNFDKKPELFLYQKPFASFALVIANNCNKIHDNLNISSPLNNVYFISNNNLKEVRGKKIWFSGMAIVNGELIAGQEDIDETTDINMLKGGIGEYTMLEIDGDAINIYRDYFGKNLLFYYISDNIKVVSNSYHLMLEVLTKQNVKLSMDYKNTLATLSSYAMEPFGAKFSLNMNVSGVKQAPNYYDIKIQNEDILFEKSEIYKELTENNNYFSINYHKLIDDAKNEIISNVKACLKSKRYKNFIVDLSGGKDSRVIYSAVTQAKQDENIYVNTKYVKTTNDLDVALKINGIYNIPYLIFGRKAVTADEKTVNSMYRSYYMGIYFRRSSSIDSNVISNKFEENELILLGAYGEVVARNVVPTYFTDSFIDELNNADDIEGFVENQIMHKCSGYFIYDEGEYADVITKALNNVVGKNLYNKLQNNHVQNLEFIHFSSIFRSCTQGEEFGAMHSKSLYKANQALPVNTPFPKAQYEVINALNPTIGSIEYEKDIDRERYKKNIKSINHTETAQHTVDIEAEKAKWEKANELAKKDAANKNRGTKNIRMGSNNLLYKESLNCLHELINNDPAIKETIGINLYEYIKHNQNNPLKLREIYNKMISVLDQIYIIKY
ncbi:MAG: hypothetical protein GYA87_02405 [Christensenellaceae bacterium]|nr:hypothetical protein [Christensenellaceae bacterium]